MTGLKVRPSAATDATAIEALYPLAFPDEDLSPLVAALLATPDLVLSLVAVLDDALIGHIAFTRGSVEPGAFPVMLLGPLAVAPAQQRRGVGSALAREGLRQSQNAGALTCFVLGDPAYYARFGFRRETAASPPYPLPDAWLDAWMSLTAPGAAAPPTGRLALPDAWMRPSLWAP